ncbi:MAG: tetratricopeptide repeat protein, partial [Deltaproteobacteria bacterium]|nr:tetratricopeptide repeat protein [Deltaproteobacteria bacterium]
LREYRRLLREKPDHPLLRLEMAGVLIRTGHPEEALSLVKSIQGTQLNDPQTLMALADLEASLGHAARCRDLYMNAISRSDRPETVKLKLADRMNMWGDFHKAEGIYRDHLDADPQDRASTLQLAAVLRSSERYSEAEGIYKQILSKTPDSKEVLMGLARLNWLRKHYTEAGKRVDQFLQLHPHDPDGLMLKADILVMQKQYEKAMDIYAELSKMTCCRLKGLIGMGKTYLEQGKEEEARSCFAEALKADPRDVEASYYAAGPEKATSEEFVSTLLKDTSISPMTLEKWARLYAADGYNRIAISCYEAALERDPDHFPAQIGLAEMLAIDQKYDRAATAFKDLAEIYPGNRKILIGWARTHGWGKKYDESIELYDRVREISPADSVAQIEKARTAVWGKKMDLALKAYEGLLSPPVDRQLAQSLKPVVQASGDPELSQAYDHLQKRVEEGSVYQGFENFIAAFEGLKPSLSKETTTQIDNTLLSLYPSFAIQKAAYLEGEGKHLAWNRRPTQAMDPYEELIEFTPGNQEAIFDYAQLQCSLGLCNREAKIYSQLLDMDKHHSLARRAMERLQIRRNPSLKLGQIYWAERGRNGLTEIDRYRTDLGVDVPIDCRFHLKLTGHHWVEHPSYNQTSYGANGFTLGASGILNTYIKGEAGWTKKIYRDDELQNTDTGYAHVWFNLRDYVVVGLGYDRTDELYNYFGIRQGIQADSWWISFDSNITRRLEVLGQAKYMSYSDDNDGPQYMWGAGYSFTDHPRIFKVALTGEYRNTRKQDVYHYEDGLLVDITHPYWTPKDYYTGAITVEWYHDLSKLFFCGSQRHFYDLALTVGTDTEHNPAVEIRGEWHYEFLNHWTFSFKGLIHRSKLWDAEGIWADIRYQF